MSDNKNETNSILTIVGQILDLTAQKHGGNYSDFLAAAAAETAAVKGVGPDVLDQMIEDRAKPIRKIGLEVECNRIMTLKAIDQDEAIKAASDKFGVTQKTVRSVLSEIRKAATAKKKEDAAAARGAREMALAGKPAFTVVSGGKGEVPDLPYTDALETLAAGLFAQTHDGKMKFNATAGKWLIWTGQRWKEDRENAALWNSVVFCEKFRLVDPENRKSCGAAKFVQNVLKLASAEPRMRVTADRLNTHKTLMGTPSGYVDLKTGLHHPPDPSLLITMATSVDPAPEADCPVWLKFLDEAHHGRADVITYLQKFFGYALSGLMTEEIMTFIYGPGGNGKGTKIKAIGAIMGDYYLATSRETFMVQKGTQHATNIASLDGPRLITASETSEDDKLDVVRIKEFTGNENPIRARFMRQDEFSFWLVGKLVIIGNDKPEIGKVDKAMIRRLRMIHMTNTPKTNDATLKDRLVAEYPAILRWLIEGAVLYFKEGLTPPASIAAASEAYLAEQDIVGDFITKALELRPQGRLLAPDHRLAIAAYMHDRSHVRKLTPNAIRKRLMEHFAIKDGYHGTRDALVGVNIRPEHWERMTDFAERHREHRDADIVLKDDDGDLATGRAQRRMKAWNGGDGGVSDGEQEGEG